MGISTAFLVVLVVFGKKFCTVFCKSNDLCRNRNHRGNGNSHELPPRATRHQNSRTSQQRVVLPAEPTETTPALSPQSSSSSGDSAGLPSAPPAYEDVIKDNPPGSAVFHDNGPDAAQPTAPPPPYSESITMTQ